MYNILLNFHFHKTYLHLYFMFTSAKQIKSIFSFPIHIINTHPCSRYENEVKLIFPHQIFVTFHYYRYIIESTSRLVVPPESVFICFKSKSSHFIHLLKYIYYLLIYALTFDLIYKYLLMACKSHIAHENHSNGES